MEKHYDYLWAEDFASVADSCRIDQTLHSLFGTSKAAADIPFLATRASECETIFTVMTWCARFEAFAANPRPGEVYNLGGDRANSISMLEAIERMTGRKLDWHYVDEARKDDHICYISNLGKIQSHFPNWKIAHGLETLLEEIISSQRGTLAQTS